MKFNISVLALSIFLLIILSGCSDNIQTTEIVLPTLSSNESLGKSLFFSHCAACHSFDGEMIIVGPSLAGIATRAENNSDNYTSKEFIEISILKPDATITEGFDDLMPKTFGKTLTSEEFNYLISFLLTLK